QRVFNSPRPATSLRATTRSASLLRPTVKRPASLSTLTTRQEIVAAHAEYPDITDCERVSLLVNEQISAPRNFGFYGGSADLHRFRVGFCGTAHVRHEVGGLVHERALCLLASLGGFLRGAASLFERLNSRGLSLPHPFVHLGQRKR